MATIDDIMFDLRDTTIADRVAEAHDDARNRYHLNENRVPDSRAFAAVTSDYTNHHCSYCMLNGGRLSPDAAYNRAKRILEREYRRRGLDYVSAVKEGIRGINGGMRHIIDTIAEGLKAESVSDYIEAVIDRHVPVEQWEAKVNIVRQIIARYGRELGDSIDSPTEPERYGHGYRELIDGLVEIMRRMSPVFRKM